MDASTPARRRVPPTTLIGLAAGLAALGLVAIVLLAPREPDQPATRPVPHPTAPARPEIEQARWDIRATAAGARARMSRRELRHLRAQRPRVGALVRTVYNALFLDPGALDRAVRSSFAPTAAHSFARMQRVGIPARAQNVKTLARGARIAIQAPRARHAAAKVVVRLRAQVDRRRLRLLHRATLWLGRDGGRWFVIAFDVEQRPLRR